MESSTHTRKPKGGRIAMVLKEARASLKEPSRPHTPASLDARTAMSLDGAVSRAERYDAKRDKRGDRVPAGAKSKKNQQPDIWVNENVDNSDDSNGDGYTIYIFGHIEGEHEFGRPCTDCWPRISDSVGGGSGSRQDSRRNSEDLDGALSSQSVFNRR